ncbi:MAG: glutamate 5-kinase [Halobacteriovorax sp.]|nr:glutamate 5-kinase [Halobacteriovorax sp.]
MFMSINIRKELKELNRVVIKVGSNVVTGDDGQLSTRVLRKLVEDICELMNSGVEVILISSGAVSVGKNYLNIYSPHHKDLGFMHSTSSIGQPKLINSYSRLFEENMRLCSQILLTHDDFRKRKRFLHTKENLDVLLKNKIVPILNENDSISFTEISVGDNDHLAAATAQMVDADLLLVITSTDGLYNKDPHLEGAKKLPFIPYGKKMNGISLKGVSGAGRGGMSSKIKAVKKITKLGIPAIISSKLNERIIIDPIENENVGTFFEPKKVFCPNERKGWLISTLKPDCSIEVDDGAFKALIESKSLLPTGVTGVNGVFYPGDCVALKYNDEIFATGISEYDYQDVKKLMGSQSQDIENILGYKKTNEIVHTLNLVVEKEII